MPTTGKIPPVPEDRFVDPTYRAAAQTPQQNAAQQAPERNPDFFRGPNDAPPQMQYRPTPMGWAGMQDLSRRSIRQRQPEIPYQSYDQAINNLPNSELLTPSERWLYGKLPLVMNKTVAGRPVGDWLESFNDSPFGKILSVLDIGAETLERGHGFLSQWSDAYLYGDETKRQEFDANLAEAWYAGSLFADMTNLPGYARDKDGKITSITIPGHLGGRDAINRARQRIAELVDVEGMDLSEALKQVRAEYYTDLGALSIRAQMQDTYYHMLLDPLQVLLPVLRPAERFQAARITATTQRLIPGSLDTLTDTANALQDAARVAEAAGDTVKAAENLKVASEILARVDSLKATKEIGSLDKFFMFMTGGDPLEPAKLFGGKVDLGGKWNPFSLTPSARANEMTTIVSNNLDTYVLGTGKDPFEIMETIARANKGALGPEFGHAFLTLEGRTSLATISAAEAAGKKLLADYVSVAPQMDIINQTARLTGDTIYDVVHYLEGDDAAAFINRIASMGDEGAQLAAQMSDDFVGVVADFNKLDMPYTPELFKWRLSEEVRDATMQMAIAKFGIKETGLVQKIAGTVKTAETLAFLRMNPTFVAKNFINNEATILGRGLAGLVTNADLAKFIDDLGFRPQRLRQAFTMAGEAMGDRVSTASKVGRTFEDVISETGKAEKRLADALRSDGFWTKLDDVIRQGGDKLPKWLDMGTYATRAERSASARAFYTGYSQGMNRYFWKPGKGYSRLADVIKPEVFESMPRNVVEVFEQGVRNIKSEADLQHLVTSNNLNLNPRAIAQDIVNEFGYDLGDRFGAPYIDKLTDQLTEAMPQGVPAVRRVIDNARDEAAKHLDDLAQAAHEIRIDKIATVTQLEGPGAFTRIWGDAVDDFHGFTVAYDARMARFVPEGLTGKAADIFWKRQKAQTGAAWERNWTRLDEVIQGMEKGAKNLLDANGKPLKIPKEITGGFKGWRSTWDDFYKLRNKLQDTFFTELIEGKTPTRRWADIQDEINAAYLKSVTNEANFTVAIDDAMTQMVRQSRPDVANAFAAWRQHARELRLQDRQDLVAFRQSLVGQSRQYKTEAWAKFWQGRQEPHIKLWRTDRSALSALLGNDVALAGWNKANEVSGASMATDLRAIANRYGIPSATADGTPFDRRIVDTVNKYLRGEYDQAAQAAEEVLTSPGAVAAEMTDNVAAQIVEQADIVDDAAKAIDPTAQTITKSVDGRTTAFGADPNVQYDFEFRVVDLDSLNASHGANFEINPNYPQELQPRLRDRVTSNRQVDKIARTLNPDSLLYDTRRLDTGPMIIGNDLVVEAGNGRVMALRKAAEQYPDNLTAYQNKLKDILPDYGLDPAQLEGINSPVLVRVRTSDVDRVKFAAEANQDVTLRMSTVEQAIQDASRLADETVAGISITPSQTIDAALNSSANRPQIRAWIQTLPENEVAALVDASGGLSRAGVQRFKDALFAKTFSGEDGQRLLNAFTESLDPFVKNVENAIYAALPDLAKFEAKIATGALPRDLSLSDDLAKTVDVLARLKQEGISVADYLAQGTLFERELDAFQTVLLEYIQENIRSPRNMRDMFTAYVNRASREAPEAQGAFFEGVRLGKDEILRDAIKEFAPEDLPMFEQFSQKAAAVPPPAITPAQAVRQELAQPAPGARPSGPIPEGAGPTPAAQQYGRLEEISPDVAEQAFEARRVFRGDPELPEPVTPAPQQFDNLLVDSDQVLKDHNAMNAPFDVAEDQHWLANGYQGLDDIEAKAIERINRPPLKFTDLDETQAAEIQKYIRHVEGQFADARMASIKYGEFRRDSALLNYNRRYNYNEWLSTIMPFEFWTTQSLAKWALHSIDRPAMLSTFMRMRKLISTAGMPQSGFPSRLKDSIRVGMPFLPEWMDKSVWVDPLRWTLPFDNWLSAYEQYRRDSAGEKGRAERLILKQVSEGTITQQQAKQAIADQSGQLWDTAVSQAAVNDAEGKTDAWDYATMMLSPHAPLTWAKEALIDGTPENIGAFLPISRTFKQAFGVLGIDTSQSKYNVAGNIRKALGLPAFDRWDDYRVDRELSNMATEGYPLDQIQRAMIEQQGPLWDEASSRAAKVFSGGGVIPFLLKTIGMPTQAYPTGEGKQRALQDDFSKAYEAYDNGDVQALTTFFDNYPEYETRLGLWDTPEERLRKFMVDNTWQRWNEMSILHRNQVKDALGPQFQDSFLSKETRNYESIPAETLQVWLKLMGGDPPGTLNSAVQPLALADDATSWQVEQFYNLRGALYPNYREQQDEYFALSESAQSDYRYQNPELVNYWNWRRDFFHRNPNTVPYLDDDFQFEYPSSAAYQAAQSGLPAYTYQEWTYILGSRSTASVLSSGDIPPGAEDYLEKLAADLGITMEQMIQLVSQSQR